MSEEFIPKPKFSLDEIENIMSSLDTQRDFIVAAKASITNKKLSEEDKTAEIGYWNVRLGQNRESYSKLLIVRALMIFARDDKRVVDADNSLKDLRETLENCEQYKDLIPADIFPIIVGLGRKMDSISERVPCEHCGMIH